MWLLIKSVVMLLSSVMKAIDFQKINWGQNYYPKLETMGKENSCCRLPEIVKPTNFKVISKMLGNHYKILVLTAFENSLTQLIFILGHISLALNDAMVDSKKIIFMSQKQ